jgi:hypothetical protein
MGHRRGSVQQAARRAHGLRAVHRVGRTITR